MSLGTTNISDLPIQNAINEQNIHLDMKDKSGKKVSFEDETNNKMPQNPTYSANIMPTPQNQPQASMQQQQQMSNANSIPPDRRPQLSQSEQEQFMHEMQQAQQQGAMSLPSRNIPMDTTQFSHDNEVKPDYVPQENNDYINSEEHAMHIQNQLFKARQMHKEKMNEAYDELQIPVLMFIIFFILQLPVVNKTLLKYLPSLMGKEGHLKFQGFVLKSLLASGGFYGLQKLLVHFTT